MVSIESRRLKQLGLIGLVLITLFLISAQNVSAGTYVANYTTTTTWTAPAGVTKVLVEAWGGGGAGGGRTVNGYAGGGGGGAYARANVTVTPSSVYAVVVAASVAGGTSDGASGKPTYFGTGLTVNASGGSGGLGAGTGGAGGAVAASKGTILYAGGNGGTQTGTASGGGGGGAGSTGAGGNAVGGTAGTGTSLFGGNGGAGVTLDAVGNPGSTYSGGGSGSRKQGGTNRAGGAGAAGFLRITIDYTPPTWIQTPTSRTAEFGYLFYYDVNATDPLGISQYGVNDTAKFKINKTTGVLQNNTQLSVGTRWIILYVNDSNNNINSTRINITTKDTRAPSVKFNYQIPADINTFNVISKRLNISYNISDPSGLKPNSVVMYYKSNTSASDIFLYKNGTSVKGYQTVGVAISNVSYKWTFLLQDNLIFPGTYNFNEQNMEQTVHSSYLLDSNSKYMKIRLFNVSNKKKYGIFEIMVRNTSSASQSLMFYYCNSSYVSGTVHTNINCVNFYALPSNLPYNHSHSQYSKHYVIPFAVNTTTGNIGTVHITPTSFFAIRGHSANGWYVSYITNISRLDTIRLSTNNGGTWSNFSGTVDAHLHQYNGTDKFWYYVCANDTLNHKNCSTARSDLFELGGLPPTAPNIYKPLSKVYSRNININYTAAQSPNNYPLTFYNITLVNLTEAFVKVIKTKNGLNLSYVWNSVGTADGNYLIKVRVCDNQGLCSYGLSENFTIDNTAPAWNQTPTNRAIPLGSALYYDVNASDVSGISKYWINDTAKFKINSLTGVLQNNTGLNSGVYWLNVSVNDTVNNRLSAVISVSVGDTTPPTWNQTPQNKTIEYATSFYYDLNASDTSGISQYRVNDTAKFKINTATGVLQNNTLLPIGTRWIILYVNDTKNNILSSRISVTIQDTRAPTWNQTPQNKTTEYGTAFYYDINASDPSGISQYRINDTAYFKINTANGIIQNNTLLPIGTRWLNISVNDTSNNKRSIRINITTKDTRKPTITLVSPPNSIIDIDGNVTFNCSATDNYLLSKIDIYLNSLLNKSNNVGGVSNKTFFKLYNLANGKYNWSCRSYDSSNNFNHSANRGIIINKTGAPLKSDFTGNTTNWNNVANITNVCNGTAILENPSTDKIIWKNCVNALGANFDSYVILANNNVTVNFGIDLSFNSTATITMKNLTWDAVPLVYRDGKLCLPPECSNVSYNPATGTAVFNVTGFTSYVTAGNSQLRIWDQTDAGMPYAGLTKYKNQQVKFFSNYSKKTDNSPITGANCVINFTGMNKVMAYNATTKLYEFNRSFSASGTYPWNSTCSRTSFQTLKTNDSVLITSDTTPPTWIQTPTSRIVEFTYPLYYDINASDNIAVDKYKVNDTTYFKINSVTGVLQNNTLLPVGVKWINISVNDTTNNKLSIRINVTIKDTIAPIWNQTPQNKTTEFATPFYYDINASDPSGISQYRVNDTAKFKINTATGVLQNNTLLPVGTRWIILYANDTKNNILSIRINITTRDTKPPTWNQTPTDRIIPLGSALYYDVNASDPSGISKYSVNNTVKFKINPLTGLLQNNTGLTTGVYWLNISVNDTHNNRLSAIINISVGADLTPPTWNETPTSRIVEFTYPLYYDINASNNVAIDKYEINDTTYFKINSANGILQNNTLLPVGIRWINISVNDTLNNKISVVINITVQDTTPPTWNQTPTNRAINLGSPFYYDVNATDPSGISQYKINDTTKFKINALNGILQNNTGLATGVYLLNISVNDTHNNKLSEIISVTIGADTAPPTWIQTPTSRIVEYTYPLYYDINATDNIAVDKYNVNDSYFKMDAVNGILQNNTLLPVGMRWINISVNDTTNNKLSIIISVTVQDTTPPSWDEAPTSRTIPLGSPLYYDVNASDASGISQYKINDTTKFKINALNGILQNNTGLNTGVYWLNISVNDTKNNRLSEIISVTVGADITPPTISSVTNGTVTNTTAVISWTTDENANSTINYGTTTGLGTYYNNGALITSHLFTLTSLLSNTTYYYNVTSCDASGNCKTSGTYNFTTLSIFTDTAPPTWIQTPTNRAINLGSPLYYDVNATDNVAVDKYRVNDTTKFKINALNGILQNNTGLNTGVYWLNISVNDTKNNKLSAVISVTVGADITPPTISSVTNGTVTNTTAVISWTTDENANSTINYGTTISLGTPYMNATLVTIHTFTLTGLQVNKTYHYNVTSCDASGNCRTAGAYSFKTNANPAVADTTPPTISNVKNGTVTNSTAFISWLTNELSNSTINYGIATSLGTFYRNATLTLSHNFTLTGLQANKTYYYNVSSCDASGNCKTSGRYSFKTAAVFIDAIPPTITSTSVAPLIVINGTNVALLITATDANLDSVWASIKMPNSSVVTIPLTNSVIYYYTTPSLAGKYNVTFYANDTSGNIANSKKYFIVQPVIHWNVTVINHESSGINSSITFHYAGTQIKYNISNIGNFNDLDIANYLYDIEFYAFNEKFRVELNGVNLSKNNNKIFGMDRNTTYPGYVVLYAVNNSYTFTNAVVYLSYSGLSYTNENYLKVYRCSSWDFASQRCLSSFAELTATQNKTGDYFTATVTGFSAFAIKQGSAPTQPAGGGGGGTGGGAVKTGGGGGAGGATKLDSREESLIIRTCLKLNQKVYFYSHEKKYDAVLAGLEGNKSTLIVGSNYLKFKDAESKTIDLDENGQADTKVLGIGEDNGKWCFELYELREKTKEKLPPVINVTKAPENVTKELPTAVKKPKNIWYYIVLTLILIPFIMFGAVKYSHKRKRIREAKKWLKSYSKIGIFGILLALAVILLIKPVTLGLAVFTGKVVPLAAENAETILIFVVLGITLLSLVNFANRNKIFVGKGIVVHKNKGQLIKKLVRYRWVGVFAIVLFLIGLVLQPVVTGLMIFKDAIAGNIGLFLNIIEAILIAVAIFVMVNYFSDRNRISFGNEAIIVRKPSSFAFLKKAGKRFKNKFTRMIFDRPQKDFKWSTLTSVKKKEELPVQPVHKIEEKKPIEIEKKKSEERHFDEVMKERVYNYPEYKKKLEEKEKRKETKEKDAVPNASPKKIKEKMLDELKEVYK